MNNLCKHFHKLFTLSVLAQVGAWGFYHFRQPGRGTRGQSSDPVQHGQGRPQGDAQGHHCRKNNPKEVIVINVIATL